MYPVFVSQKMYNLHSVQEISHCKILELIKEIEKILASC